MKEINFNQISEAYAVYLHWFQKFNKYEFNSKEMPSYYILNNIFSSFLAEIGLKALIAYENKVIKADHSLDSLFNLLSSEYQNNIAELMEYEFTELEKKLKENAEHFEKWRYYYELGASSFDIQFMNKLLMTIAEILKVLKDRN